MFSERFQILISPEQRARLEQEAKDRGVSVAALVREAIDSRFHIVSREEKIRAAEEIAEMGSDSDVPLTVEEINQILDKRYDDGYPEPIEPRR